jgi:hypothetical protein
MKIPEIYLKGKKDPGLVDFMDYTSIILNQGLYQMRTIATVPAWIANEGESLLYSSGGVRRVYYYIDGSWKYLQWGGGNSLSLLADSDYDTKVDVEENFDEDIIRFDSGGTERMIIDVNGLQLAEGLPIVFDGTGGDTTWQYVTATAYMTAYVDGSKRMEM